MSVQTLFRCGVCFEMFTSSEDCYAHIVTHEIGVSSDQETITTLQAEESSATADAQEQEAVSQISPTSQEADGYKSLTGDVSKDTGTETYVVEKEADSAEVLDVLGAVSSGPRGAGSGEVVQQDNSGRSVLVDNMGAVLQLQQLEGRSTSEDLDIADILINIKQEKTDEPKAVPTVVEDKAVSEPNDLVQLTNQVSHGNENINPETSSGNASVGTCSQGNADVKSKKTKKKKKKGQMKKQFKVKSEVFPHNEYALTPIVRRKKKGENSRKDVRDIEAYACKTCGKRYAILKSLKYHEKTHDLDSLHYCDVCHKGFVKPSELTNHKKSHTVVKEKKKDDLYKCKYCDKEYQIEKSLKHHEKVHEIGKRFTCELCKKNFFKPSDLLRHERAHIPLAKCYICCKSFRDADKLEQHVRQHPEIMLQNEKLQIKGTNLMYCKYCNKKCTTFSQLCNHVRVHTKKKPFPCDVCGKMFNRVSNMRLHRKLHSGSKPFNCEKCGTLFADLTNRNRHMKKYHAGDDSLSMSYKPRSSKVMVVEDLPPAPKLKVQRETLINELRSAYEDLDQNPEDDCENVVAMNSLTPKGKSLVQCREVHGIPEQVQQMISVGTGGSQISNKNVSVDTMPESTSEQVYVVFEDNPSICYVLEYEGDKNTSAETKKTMVEQMTMTDEVELLDQTGEEAQSINSSLAVLEGAAHVEDEEADEDEEVDSDDDDAAKIASDVLKMNDQQAASLKRFTCTNCGLRFKHQGSLKFHYRKHTKEGVMYCEICNAEFYRKSRLRIHMRDHTGERPYKCSMCQQAFKVHYDLTVHQRQHTGYGALQCPHCPKIFYTRRALNAHLRSQSQAKPFSCVRCGKLFKRQDQRRRHMLIHYGDMPFHCHMCDRAFGDSSNRKRHIIKNHGKDALDSLPKGRISLVKSIKNILNFDQNE